MIELNGKHNTAIIYSDKAEDKSFEQIKKLSDLEAFADADIKIMPDHHAGADCVIGFVSADIKNIVPNIIGLGIRCGILVWKLSRDVKTDLALLNKIIREEIPNGLHIGDTDEVMEVIKSVYNFKAFDD